MDATTSTAGRRPTARWQRQRDVDQTLRRLGQGLAPARRRRRMRQADVAERIGVSRSAYSRMERGVATGAPIADWVAAALTLGQVAAWIGGGDHTVRGVWIVRATRRNRDLVSRYPAVFAAAFSGSSRAWVAALVQGSEPPAAPGLVWCDIRATRVFEWRR